MRQVKYLLIGGGLASVRAAQQIRLLDPNGPLLLVSDEVFLPYDRPPLSKDYLRGLRSLGDISLQAPADAKALDIEVRLGDGVVELDASARVATLGGGETVQFEKALIATGGRPIQLDLPGADLQGVHYLRTAADADALREAARTARRAVIIGGGFIGLEVAAALTMQGLDVVVLEALPTVWARFGSPELSDYVTGYCTERGVTIRTSTLATEFLGDHKVRGVMTSDGEELECDLICVGVGIRPNVELAEAAGIDVDNGVVVDERMRTSDANIYAAGDLINYPDPHCGGRRRRVEHWGHAEHSGQIAGRNMAGGDERYDLLSYVWSDVFDLHFEFAGDEHDHDQLVVRGSPADGAFMVIYLREGRVTAYVSVNVPAREYSNVRRMIQTGMRMSGREAALADTSVNLKALLKPA